MDDLDALGRSLLNSKDGGAIRALAESREAESLARALGPDAGREAEAALRSGDGEKLKALLSGVLSTREGRALAEAVSRLGGEK